MLAWASDPRPITRDGLYSRSKRKGVRPLMPNLSRLMLVAVSSVALSSHHHPAHSSPPAFQPPAPFMEAAANPPIHPASPGAIFPLTPTAQLGVTPTEQVAWEKVAACEEGSRTFDDAAWHVQGPVYSGIGFLNTTWRAYGGNQFAPNAGAATADQQIIVGERIEGSFVPDQYGCSSW